MVPLSAVIKLSPKFEVTQKRRDKLREFSEECDLALACRIVVSAMTVNEERPSLILVTKLCDFAHREAQDLPVYQLTLMPVDTHNLFKRFGLVDGDIIFSYDNFIQEVTLVHTLEEIAFMGLNYPGLYLPYVNPNPG